MSRREFKKPVKVEIITRAHRVALDRGLDPLVSGPICEKCGQPTKYRFEIHHLREDGLEVDKSKPLTATDGALWCVPCHKDHTAKVSVPIIAKAKRREAAHLGAKSAKAPIKSDSDALKSSRRPKHEGRTSLPPRALYR